MVSGLGLALIAMLAFSAAATGAVLYDQVSGVSVSYNVVAAPPENNTCFPVLGSAPRDRGLDYGGG